GAPHAGDHPVDDEGGAHEARSHQGEPQAAHRRRLGRVGAGSQPAAVAVRADAVDDEEDAERRPREDDAGHERNDARAAVAARTGRADAPGASAVDFAPMEANRTDPTEAQPVDLDGLRKSFAGRLVTDPADLEAFTIDWRRRYFGRALAVAQPESVDDVAAVVRWCAGHRVAVVPQGGNTGLSGGATPDDSGRSIVLSLARLTRVRSVDTINNSITVEAGCTLA